MIFQVILNSLFFKPRPFPHTSLMKQIANKKEIFQADPHLGIINLIKLFLALFPFYTP